MFVITPLTLAMCMLLAVAIVYHSITVEFIDWFRHGHIIKSSMDAQSFLHFSSVHIGILDSNLDVNSVAV